MTGVRAVTVLAAAVAVASVAAKRTPRLVSSGGTSESSANNCLNFACPSNYICTIFVGVPRCVKKTSCEDTSCRYDQECVLKDNIAGCVRKSGPVKRPQEKDQSAQQRLARLRQQELQNQLERQRQEELRRQQEQRRLEELRRLEEQRRLEEERRRQQSTSPTIVIVRAGCDRESSSAISAALQRPGAGQYCTLETAATACGSSQYCFIDEGVGRCISRSILDLFINKRITTTTTTRRPTTRRTTRRTTTKRAPTSKPLTEAERRKAALEKFVGQKCNINNGVQCPEGLICNMYGGRGRCVTITTCDDVVCLPDQRCEIKDNIGYCVH